MSKYINPPRAPRVAEILRAHGYAATTDDCTGYAINVARRFEPHAGDAYTTVLTLIADALGMDVEDAEGYPLATPR